MTFDVYHCRGGDRVRFFSGGGPEKKIFRSCLRNIILFSGK